MSWREALTIVLSNLFGFVAGYIVCWYDHRKDGAR